MAPKRFKPIVVTLFRGNKKVAIGFVLFLSTSPLSGSVISFVQHLWVLGAILGGVGLAGLAAVRPIARLTEKTIHQLIFDDAGFRYRNRFGDVVVPWSDVTRISLHRDYRTNSRHHHVCLTYLDFWPADNAMARRTDLAKLWQAKGARGHFRMGLLNGARAPEIQRGVRAFRPDLWRKATSEDHRKKWWQPATDGARYD